MDLLFLILLAVLVVMLVRSQQRTVAQRSGRSRPGQIGPAAQQRWDAVRAVAAEDVTALGHQIADLPVDPNLDEDGRRDFDDALASYERAKAAMDAAQHPDDLQWVTRSLDDGRFALARLNARSSGAPLPERRPPCFFDQRHGLATTDADWAPPEGQTREVPVCAACAARIADGQDPQARLVPTPQGPRPYYDAGPEYGPWARGWYAGSGVHVLNNVLLGTLLFNSMMMPSLDPGFGDDFGGEEGGDFDGGDGGGGFDGGGFDGGGFDF